MGTECNKEWTAKLDARIISLFARSANEVIFRRSSEAGRGYYPSFAYFDLIKVSPVSLCQNTEESGGSMLSPLFSAYQASKESDSDQYPFRQNILAFCDLDDHTPYERIDLFWKSQQPIIFFTTINLLNARCIDRAKKSIASCFQNEEYLLYHSFESFDLLLVYKGNSFNQYTENIFRLNYEYGSRIGLVDSFTFFGMDNINIPSEINETFNSQIEFSVNNMSAIPSITKSIQNLDCEVKEFWTLGRRDCCLWLQNLSLNTLFEVLDHLKQQEQKKKGKESNIDNIRLTVSTDPHNQIKGQVARSKPHKNSIATHVRLLLDKFSHAFTTVCKNLHVEKDEVFIKWIEESCGLACALYNNSLSHKIGQCLLPHYADFFIYFIRLERFMNKLTDEQLKWDVEKADEFRKGNKNFFTTILSLIDSMDQSNRQFIHGPSFHSISIDMPPKLLAFYTAITHQLVHALKDSADEQNFYGVTLAPSFVTDLTVTPLSIADIYHRNQENDPYRDQLLAIDIGEASIYDMTHTIGVLTHEISHYVGKNNRCRTQRAEYMVRYAIHQIVDRLCEDFFDTNMLTIDPNQMLFNEICILTRSIYEQLIHISASSSMTPPRAYTGIPYMNDIRSNALPYVFEDITFDPAPRYQIVHFFFELFHANKYIDSTQHTKWYQWMKKNLGTNSSCQFKKRLLLNKIDSDVQYWAKERKGKIDIPILNCVTQANESWRFIDAIISLYSETFADMQTIILLQLDFNSYIDLLLRNHIDDLSDIMIRMVAVGSVMCQKQCEYWCNNDLSTLAIHNENPEAVKNVWELMQKKPAEDCDVLRNAEIDPAMLFYLCEYLSVCYDEINNNLVKQQFAKKEIEGLQSIYSHVRKNGSISALEQDIMCFISDAEANIVNDIKNCSKHNRFPATH